MLKNLYREKMKFFNKNLHRNKTLIIDESDKNYTKDEIYIFSKEQRWKQYEGIQSDIFEHILAVVSEFDLKIFQSPTGADFKEGLKH